jgi:3-deoxy-7-phosphoheptulonate synthase
MNDWSLTSWQEKPNAQMLPYADEAGLAAVLKKVRELPPIVTSWEIERLKRLIADAQVGRRFLLQGGDCAETFADCRPSTITNRLKILLQMSFVLAHAFQGPVIRVGRFAGQYTKPRSSPTETRDGVTLPSFLGDNVNRSEFSLKARTPDPSLILEAHQYAALTLNFTRSLLEAGFADMHHPEYWELAFFRSAPLKAEIRAEYEAMTTKLSEALRFMSAVGERTVEELTRVDFYTSHEGLHLPYEAAQTFTVPRRSGHYDLSTHFPWIGERTRAPDGAHVEFFRGLQNPLGVKLGPNADPADVVRTIERLNPNDEPGKIALITRLGAANVTDLLPPLIDAVRRSQRRVLWVTDPMHGNTRRTASGRKTRHFDDILLEVQRSFEVHEARGTHLGGVHFELTGDDVTECTGGAAAITESDLDGGNYASACDPRLNYQQALEMSFLIARMWNRRRRASERPNPSFRH